MTNEPVFRWIFAGVFIGMFLVSGYFRRRARQSGEAIERRREGKQMLIARLLVAVPLYVSFVTYAVNPRWMDWSSLDLPAWLRWLAVAGSVGMVPLLYWVMTSIGKNVSETVLTKESHELVTHGPYRWVRHPLYAVATMVLIGLGVVAANWFMIGMAVLALAGILMFVIPKEEAELVRKFGSQYRNYQQRTGRLTPRLIRKRQTD